MPDGKDLIREYEHLVSCRRHWEPVWRDIIEFVMPNSRRQREFYTAEKPRPSERWFDSTAADANRKLSNFMHGALTSNSTRWFNLTTRDEALMRNREVSIWLDDTATRIYGALQQSNFSAVAPQVYASLCALGNAAVYLEERDLGMSGFNGFRFTVIPVGRYVAAESHEGIVDTFMRTFEMSAKAAAGKFGLDNLPDHIKQAYQDPAKAHDRFCFLHVLKPRAGKGGMTAKQMPVASYYIDMQSKDIIKESGYPEMPVFVPRWETEEGEVYGRGPGHIALPDTRTLNKVKQLGLEALALQVRPPLQVPQDGVLGGTVRLTPAAQNVTMNGAEVKPLELGHDLKSEMVKGEELRQAIRGVFHRDLVALPDKNYMTATEIIKQLDLTNRELGPTVGNIQDQFLRPMIERAFAIMLRREAFLDPPAELGGADLDLEYEGQLARAQRVGDLTAVQGNLALIAGMAEIDPSVMDNLDTDELVDYIWIVSGVPKRLLRSKAARDKIRESRAQAAQLQAQVEQAQGVMDVAHTGAQAGKTMREAMQPQGTACELRRCDCVDV
jgi:hypothetical protein